MRINWLALVAALIILMPGAISSARSSGIQTTKFQAGLVVGNSPASSNYSYDARYTCGAAKTKIKLAGYKELKTLNCSGNIFSFTGWINAHRTEVGFNATTGQILYF